MTIASNIRWRQWVSDSLVQVAALAFIGGCQSQTLPRHWMVPEPAIVEGAPVHFRFPKPIEGYRGRTTAMRGRVHLGEGGSLINACGWFEVDVKSVTFGEDALDDSVRNSIEFLYSEKFPTVRFDFSSIESLTSFLNTTIQTEGYLVGTFALKGVSIPLRARATLQPRRDENRRWLLDLSAVFTLEQLREVFHIAGPGGESEPAGNRMLFDVKTTLVSCGNMD